MLFVGTSIIHPSTEGVFLLCNILDLLIYSYYEKIRQGKQEKLFHEVIFQIGNREDMAVGTSEGNLAVKILDEYVKDFQKRNPTLRVFSCYLHQDEATPHLHIDFVPYVTN